ncbi:MAG: hydantoinase B/oxoprolinase family protein [Bacterioplanes sp.]|nr:hydantoinase B/oxoprolinase family protein [Bacterioplanes sp.]
MVDSGVSQAQSSVTVGWQFWVDRGGTFTDIVALTPSGQCVTHKLLSDNPAVYDDAAVAGIAELQDRYSEQPTHIQIIKMGTTVATNALLERKGEPMVLMITRGLADQLEIGYQTRPDIFAIAIEQAAPLYEQVYEVAERVLADGSVDLALDDDATWVQLQEAYGLGYRSVAVVCMHAYKYPEHEQRIGQMARQLGFTQVSLSHEVSPLIKLVPRGDTTLADAYLSPILQRYVARVQAAFPNVPIRFMQSSGGLTQAQDFHGKDAVLSGPAGGVVGMVRSAMADGFHQLVGFDMGGTSTDVSHYAGELERASETQLCGLRLRVPMLNIHTVAAGGGSVLRFADGRFQVGPESAGAFPGPACYRNGGPLTVTDCNVVLGKLQPDLFPTMFGPKQDQALDDVLVRQRFAELAHDIEQETGQRLPIEAIAEGFLTVAVDSMATAVKKISIQRGYDLSQYTLNAFGGAGGQHACLVADALGIQRVYLHPLAGVLSAFGIGMANERWLVERAIELPLPVAESAIQQAFAQLSAEQPYDGQSIQRVYIRYEGSDTPLLVNYGALTEMARAFTAQHQQAFGFIDAERALVVDAIQLEVVTPAPGLINLPLPTQTQQHEQTVRCFCRGQWRTVPILRRTDLAKDFSAMGPLLLVDDNSTLVVEPDWRLTVLASGACVLERLQQAKTAVDTAFLALSQPTPVQLEVFNNVFMSIAEQMGVVLEKTASSVNMKERLDFSCALFDGQGDLVANAPHIPVHLGSMSDSIKVVMQGHPTMRPGDAFVLNTPYNGGTHLPDVTVVKPVFIECGATEPRKPDFYVAARGHHADIGGIAPGSMPADSRHLDEEGILLDNLVLVRGGELQRDNIMQALTRGPYPARNPEQNMADLYAQLAACEAGSQALHGLAEQVGLHVVQQYMGWVQDNAEQTLRRRLRELADGEFVQQMDDGSRFAVVIRVDRDQGSATIDFSGSGYRPEQPLHPGNFNAPSAIVHAAVLYCFRVLVAAPIPLNAGFFRPLTITIPPNSMIAPQYPAAVVSGNVETAQYLVDTLMGALGLMACSQGTNNNLTFGNDQFQYYETLAGGSGACALSAGASAVQVHMTNSRLTDPEVLEQRFPVMLEWFHRRRHSGGQGRFDGGDGLERRLRFLQPMTLNIISGHRQVAPFGLAGGSDGALGVNWIKRASGVLQRLPGCAQAQVDVGDVVAIHTPGGGGFGVKEDG